MPAAAQKLQRDYVKSIEDADAPIRDRYVAALTKLYDLAMSSGKPDEALALKREINLQQAQPLLGRWNDAEGGGVLDIRRDGSLGHSNGSTGHWELKGEVICLFWDNGWKHEIPLAKPGAILRGKILNPSGETKSFSETRPHEK